MFLSIDVFTKNLNNSFEVIKEVERAQVINFFVQQDHKINAIGIICFKETGSKNKKSLKRVKRFKLFLLLSLYY
jgi:hypothetical protein